MRDILEQDKIRAHTASSQEGAAIMAAAERVDASTGSMSAPSAVESGAPADDFDVATEIGPPPSMPENLDDLEAATAIGPPPRAPLGEMDTDSFASPLTDTGSLSAVDDGVGVAPDASRPDASQTHIMHGGQSTDSRQSHIADTDPDSLAPAPEPTVSAAGPHTERASDEFATSVEEEEPRRDAPLWIYPLVSLVAAVVGALLLFWVLGDEEPSSTTAKSESGEASARALGDADEASSSTDDTPSSSKSDGRATKNGAARSRETAGQNSPPTARNAEDPDGADEKTSTGGATVEISSGAGDDERGSTDAKSDSAREERERRRRLRRERIRKIRERREAREKRQRDSEKRSPLKLDINSGDGSDSSDSDGDGKRPGKLDLF
jgi:hypothetical protein